MCNESLGIFTTAVVFGISMSGYLGIVIHKIINNRHVQQLVPGSKQIQSMH